MLATILHIFFMIEMFYDWFGDKFYSGTFLINTPLELIQETNLALHVKAPFAQYLTMCPAMTDVKLLMSVGMQLRLVLGN